jgi:hypothetical protein
MVSAAPPCSRSVRTGHRPRMILRPAVALAGGASESVRALYACAEM